MAEVSVIIPTYNRAGFLDRSIGSVLAQSYGNLELIVVDDGSTDHTKGVVAASADPRVRYVVHEQNRGAPAARNTGLEKASGRFIAFQDSDDEWMEEKLVRQMEVLECSDHRVGLVHTGFSRMRGAENQQTEWLPKPLRSGDCAGRILKGNFIGTPTVLARRECFENAGRFDTRLDHLEDWEMWIRIAQSFHVAYLDRTLVATHDLPDSLSADLGTLIQAHEYILRKHRSLFAKDRKILAAEHYWIGNLLCRSGKMPRGREAFFRALKSDPLNMKCFAGILFSLLGREAFKRVVGLREKMREA